jgi:hypothetical protein
MGSRSYVVDAMEPWTTWERMSVDDVGCRCMSGRCDLLIEGLGAFAGVFEGENEEQDEKIECRVSG